MTKKGLHIILIVCSFLVLKEMNSQEDSFQVEQTEKTKIDSVKNINRGVEIKFLKKEIEPKEGEILSNVLCIINHNSEERIVLPEYNYPGNWKFIGKKDVWYEVLANDTLYIPVRIIPKAVPKGQSIYQINVHIFNNDGIQILTDHFNCATKKNSEWQVNNHLDKIYFRNDETTTEIGFDIINSSVLAQDVFMSVNSVKGLLRLSDGENNLENGTNQTYTLDSFGDTTFTYLASIDNLKRNFRKVSLVGYNPISDNQKRNYQVYLHTREPKVIGNQNFFNGSKIDLVKLPNTFQVQPFGKPTLPLDILANYQNILGENPFLSVNMSGMKSMEDNAFLTYFSQINYSQVYWNKDILRNIPWYIGYFKNKYNVQAGAINGGIIGLPISGKGIKGEYSIDPNQQVGGFLNNSRGFLKFGHTDSYGLSYRYSFQNNGTALFNAGRFVNNLQNTDGLITSLRSNFILKDKHSIVLFGAYSNRNSNYIGTLTNQSGMLFGASYNSRFIENKLQVNGNVRYNTKFFGTGNSERLSSNSKIQYLFNEKMSVYYSMNFNDIKTFSSTTGFLNPFSSFDFIQNRIIFSKITKFGTINPGLYYHVNDHYDYNVHTRGLSFRYSTLDFQKNTLFSFYTEGGYAKSIADPELDDFFNLTSNILFRYQTLTLTANYRYGVFNRSALEYQKATSSAPQMARIAASHQYQFKNPHWILESATNYTYNNRFKTQTLGIFPELFYFSNSGWRYSINPNYTLRVAKYNDQLQNIYNTIPTLDDDQSPTITKGFRIGASVRKNFGIPIPFMKHHSSSCSFLAFYDLDGNGKQDKQEPTIENVVIRVGNYEVLTNSKGFALLENLPNETYSLTTVPLDDLNGWFAKTEDSLSIVTSNIYPIPFVRGVKVIGNVVLDRQQIAIVDDREFDLSNIRITANNGDITYSTLTNFNGSFELYLPNGSYVLTINETILGDKYSLLQNNIKLTLDSKMENVHMSFFIVERQRKIKMKKFGEGQTIIKSKE